MWQASELAVAVVLGDAAVCGDAIRAETGIALGPGDDAVADAVGDATGRGARFAFASAELTEGRVSEFSVRHATMDLFREPQDSSITSRAVGAGAASPDSIMKEVRARSRFTPPIPSEPFAPDRISAIFASRFLSASAASFTGGAAITELLSGHVLVTDPDGETRALALAARLSGEPVRRSLLWGQGP